MLYERFADRYRSDEAKPALVTWFQVHSVLILACIGILPACLITLCYLGFCGCGYSEKRPYTWNNGECAHRSRILGVSHHGIWTFGILRQATQGPSPLRHIFEQRHSPKLKYHWTTRVVHLPIAIISYPTASPPPHKMRLHMVRKGSSDNFLLHSCNTSYCHRPRYGRADTSPYGI